MGKEVLTAKCRFCGKEVFSLYGKQLEHNMGAHEKNCPMKKKPVREEK